MEKDLLPYNTSVDILSKILTELKMAGKEGVLKETLFKNIGDEPRNSYTLTQLRFLNLIEGEGTKVKLTKLGVEVVYAQQDAKNAMLIRNLPDKYLTMAKWIFHSDGGVMLISDMKSRVINSFESGLNPIVIGKAVTTFLNYGKYIGLLDEGAKQNTAMITVFGKKVLALEASVPVPESQSTQNVPQPPQTQGGALPAQSTGMSTLPIGTSYPVRIITTDRDFVWDVKTDADLAVIDAAITAIKENWIEWKKKKNHTEGGSLKDDKKHD